jgi:hypothetical protein
MTQSHDIRRHPDGAIDLDFYRAGATALYRQAMQDSARSRAGCAAMLGMAAALAVTVMTVTQPMQAPGGPVAVAQADVQPIR